VKPAATTETAAGATVIIDEGWSAIKYDSSHITEIDCSDLVDTGLAPFASAVITELPDNESLPTVKIYDSGATSYMTPYQGLLENYCKVSSHSICAANLKMFQAISMGNMYVTVPNRRSSSTCLLKNVLHAPSMSAILVSLGCLDNAGLYISFWNGTCQIRQGLCRDVIASIPKINGLYRVSHGDQALSALATKILLYKLHRQLGHASYSYLKQMLKDGSITRVNFNFSQINEQECKACLRSKASQKQLLMSSSLLKPKILGISSIWTSGALCRYRPFTMPHTL
jgi:hypothetical protein